MSNILPKANALKTRSLLVAAFIWLLVISVMIPVALADDDTTRDPLGYYPSEAFQEQVDSVLQNPTEREFEYLLDAILPLSNFANYIESTILSLRDLNTERFDGFIDSNFINPPPPSPPSPPPAPGTPEPPVVWPSEEFQNRVERLTRNPSNQEFNYLLDQVIAATRGADYIEYIILNLRDLYRVRVNDFIRYLVTPV